MISQREVARKYEKLLKKVKEDDFYKINLENRVNCYVCQKCTRITKTQDIDAGVTPMMFTCRFCGSSARSTFYKDIEPDLIIHGVWYRPTLKEVLKMRKEEFMLDHILSGGLKYRENNHTISQDAILEMQKILSESEFEKECLNTEL